MSLCVKYLDEEKYPVAPTKRRNIGTPLCRRQIKEPFKHLSCDRNQSNSFDADDDDGMILRLLNCSNKLA